ncbi:DUF4145 domain-containing protein [Microbacterium sp. PMB16]|uniref:DUF4145 domain-containing protein n=1 Tax=Microbacterium sp. PMB16 TaxID=3120157 RepID=UPI003F4B623F
MATPTEDIWTLSAAGSYNRGDNMAYTTGVCPSCGALQFIVVARTKNEDRGWLRCINCKLAVAVNGGMASPAQKPLRVPSGLPSDEEAVWAEIRECLGVGAYTASVMLCRKLLMHVAVAHGLPAKNGSDFAPNFKQCTDHLLKVGIVTTRMQPWIERIKNVGNEANHELSPVGKDSALDVATFTMKLLELAYEMDDTMAKASPVEGE